MAHKHKFDAKAKDKRKRLRKIKVVVAVLRDVATIIYTAITIYLLIRSL